VDADARSRALAFLSVIEDACAERIVAVPGGAAILDSRHPRLWDANHVRVEATEAPGAVSLDRTARAHFDGLGFQTVSVLHAPAGVALTEPMRSLCYRAAPQLLMVLDDEEPAAAPSPAAAVSEVRREALAASRIAGAIDKGRDIDVGRQLVSRDALIAGVVNERCFAVELEERQVAARCQLYAKGQVAQIENVYTVPAHRRRGLSRALVAHAAREARAGGATLVFLVADAADWPQAFYRRAGFADAGLLPRFLRTDDDRLSGAR
jgi:N-acetylglutamate synthase-like GNAT family acetyltransferase